MRLLFLTQVLDGEDAVLGFVSRWIGGLAGCVERVRVVALEVGDTAGLPTNVDWREIGRQGRVGRYLRYRRVLDEALAGDGFDTVLAHMVPRYALVARRPARRHGAGLFLWYTHKGVDARLRRAVPLVDKVFTASPESLRIDAANKVVTGHGIDLEHFSGGGSPAPEDPVRLLSVGRLTPAKDPLTVVEALAQLVAEGRDVVLEWVGGGLVASDEGYEREVRERVEALGLAERVAFSGAVPYRDVPERYRAATVFVNASHTGSLDKVVLEAMASERPILSCNDSAPHLLRAMGRGAQELLFEAHRPDSLAHALRGLLEKSAGERARLGARLREIVREEHEVDGLMARLVREMRPGPALERRGGEGAA